MSDRTTPAGQACKALLIYPRFNAGSFWNYQATCELIGAKYPAPPLGLITVAAMLPETWDVRLVDRNTDDLTDDHLAWADVVLTGGMLPQQGDTLALIRQCRAVGVPVVVGGPDATSSPHVYEEADFRVLGEAEGILSAFLDAWERGERQGTFTAEKFKADVTTSPIPRFDLLNFSNYVQVNVQYSRGCPFTCEFCDIIELYGRKPRTKTNEQMLAELDRLHALGYRGHVDFVDDNLIGNKKAVKAFLPALAEWQRQRKRPFEMSTEASLNLADDDELLSLMQEAGFFSVFIGIESPDPDVLNATRKKQNTRRDIAKSVHKIYGAGIWVLAGFIVGFDEENDRVAEEISALIEEAAIPVSMVGLLYALPNTQLTRRLEREGRLHAEFDISNAEADQMGDQCTSGLNFDTRRSRASILRDYRKIVDDIYTPEAYFRRVRRVADHLRLDGANGQLLGAGLFHDLKLFGRLLLSMSIRHPEFRGPFWRTLAYAASRDLRSIKPVLMMMALYVHLGPFSRYVVSEIDKQIEDVEQGRWTRPVETAA